MFTLRKRGKYWTARIQTPGGERFERSTKETNKRIAERVAERLEREASLSEYRIGLEYALALLYKHKQTKGDSAGTLEILRLKGRHLIEFFGKDRDVSTLTLEDANEYLTHRRQRVADSTVAKELSELTQALRHLGRHDRYLGDPAALWPPALPHSFPARDRWLTADEYDAIKGAITQRWRDHLVVSIWQAVRRGELFALRAEHVGTVLHIPGTKTQGARRWMPLFPESAEVLTRRARTAGRGPLFPPQAKDVPTESRAWNNALRRACEHLDIEHVSPNDLRRTFVSWAYQRDVDEREVIRWMGHTSSAMVRRVYAQTSIEKAAREAGKLSAPNTPQTLSHERKKRHPSHGKTE